MISQGQHYTTTSVSEILTTNNTHSLHHQQIKLFFNHKTYKTGCDSCDEKYLNESQLKLTFVQLIRMNPHSSADTVLITAVIGDF